MSDILSKPVAQIAAAVILPNVGGWASGIITKKHIKSWYEHLNLPKCRPPNFVFPIAWTSLYTSMGYASYLVWRHGGGFNGAARFPLMLYGAQFALNMAWTPLFFGMHELKWSCVEIVALTATAAATGVAFFNVNRLAGLLFVPYVGWLCFATYLNYSIYRMNPAIEENKSEEKTKEK